MFFFPCAQWLLHRNPRQIFAGEDQYIFQVSVGGFATVGLDPVSNRQFRFIGLFQDVTVFSFIGLIGRL